VRVIKTSAVTIECETTAPVQIDGDPSGTTSTSFRCLPGELELFVPETGVYRS
jgi:diacylglycerol kinase family enzyme